LIKFSKEIFNWEVDNERYRKESWKQLEVWKLRKQQVQKQKKDFREIASHLSESPDNIKKLFYRAYERIYGIKYDSEQFLNFAKLVKKSDLYINM
jgi:hypothetical protein